MKRLILNGRIERVPTLDDFVGTIGIRQIVYIKSFSGLVEKLDQFIFPLAKEMKRYTTGGCRYINLFFYISSEEIDPHVIESKDLEHIFGFTDVEYSMVYRDGESSMDSTPLYTIEKFSVADYSLYDMFLSYIGKHIHLEMELYSDHEISKNQKTNIIELSGEYLTLRKKKQRKK